MAWNPEWNLLREHFVELFPDSAVSLLVVESAGIPSRLISQSNVPATRWHSIIHEAARQGMLPALIASALMNYPQDPVLQAAMTNLKSPESGRRTVDWRIGPDLISLEKIIGAQSSLVPVVNLHIAWERQRSVCRVCAPEGFGSGFLIEGGFLLTNNHVIADAAQAQRSRIEFNFQIDEDGQLISPEEYELHPADGFATSVDDDWTAVKVAEEVAERWGLIPPAGGVLSMGDRVNIIQHPDGGPKQISFYHNEVQYIDESRIQYLTDTLPGSSGSPVFDKNWNLVAIHHAGGYMRDPRTGLSFYRNEGIPIGVILEGMGGAGLGRIVP